LVADLLILRPTAMFLRTLARRFASRATDARTQMKT